MESYIGTIQAFAFSFAPQGWAQCNGQILPKSQNEALYGLIGTTYGGTPNVNFALPDLRGRVMLSAGQMTGGANYPIGTAGGSENVTLSQINMPAHSHGLMASTEQATSPSPGGGLVLAAANGSDPGSGDNVIVNIYGPATSTTPLSPAAISPAGGVKPVSVLQPYLAANYCIMLSGIAPPRA